MLHVLLESRTTRTRRRGGAVVSVVTHAVVVGTVVLLTMRESRAGETPPEPATPVAWIDVKRIEPAPATPPRPVSAATGGAATAPAIDPPAVASIDVSRIPVGIPDGPLAAIDAGPASPASAAGRLGPDPYAAGSALPGAGQALEEHAVDRAARVLSAPPPRYPERIRRMGIGGRVVVQFVIDTLGRVEPDGIRVVQSAHAELSEAVLAALPGLRFVPAEAAGRRVRQLARMPFDFVVRE
jgi:protein TonB